MNALAGPFKQLVERRLWPLALLLVVALVAVPMLLRKPVSGTDVVPVAAAGPTGESATDSIVSQADPARTDKVRAVLGDRKDPFRPAEITRAPKPETAGTGPSVSTQVDTGASGSTSASTGGGGGGGSTAPTTPVTAPTTPVVTATPTAAPTVYQLYSLQVRFGLVDGDLATRNVKRLAPLPSAADPAILYLGLSGDHKSAVFLVDAGVKTLGDGSCDPAPKNCETLTLKPGQTEFFTRGKKQWQLDLIDIHTKKTTDAKAAAASRTAVSKPGAKALKAMAGRARGYRYDSTTGTLRKVPVMAAKTAVKHESLRYATIQSTG